MNAPRLLEGVVDLPTMEALEAENAQLRAQLRLVQAVAARTSGETEALRRLQAHLTPLYQALCGIFSDLDGLGITPTPTADARVAPVWDAWKTRLGPSCAKVIEALLLHGAMNTTQLAIAIGTSRKPIPNLIYKLNQAGLLTKDGGKFSLKQL